MPTNTLTDSRCRSAKPADRDYKLFDGGGLYLFVTSKGSKLWRLAYRVGGKQKTISFGHYPDVSLADARAKRDAAKSQVREGEDPMAPRRAKRKGITLAQASDKYWSSRADISDSYRDNARRGIEMHLLPALGERNVDSIGRDDLLQELNRMDAAGLHVYVRKVRLWISQVFDWAVEQGQCTINPAALIKPDKAFGKAKVESFSALDLREVPDFLKRLAMEKDLVSVLACRMLAYTWVRTNELRMMEDDEIDLDAGTWIIPAGKMKRARDHVVPLPTQAVAIIKEMLNRRRPGSKYLFQHPYRGDRPMSENAILYLIARIGYKGKMTGHGWRSVASTWANEQGYNEDAIELQLSHVPKNKIRAVYNRAKYLDVRRDMLQAHADWIDSHWQVNAVGA